MMWDAPAPFEGYRGAVNGRIIYPIIVAQSYGGSRKPQCNWRMVLSSNSSNWMEESEYIREPTQEELSTQSWDFGK